MIVKIITTEPESVDEQSIWYALEALGYDVDAVDIERAFEIGAF